MNVTHVNPPALHTNPAFSQGTIVDAGRLLFVGGQNGTDAEGRISGDAAAQTEQALRNVLAVLDAAGAGPQDVAKMTVLLANGVDVDAAYAVVPRVWGLYPTAITVALVARLGRPEALVEIEAVAALGPAASE